MISNSLLLEALLHQNCQTTNPLKVLSLHPQLRGGKKTHLGKLAYTRGFTIMAMLGLVDICLKDWHSNLQDLVSVVSSLPAFMTKMQLLPIETPQ